MVVNSIINQISVSQILDLNSISDYYVDLPYEAEVANDALAIIPFNVQKALERLSLKRKSDGSPMMEFYKKRQVCSDFGADKTIVSKTFGNCHESRDNIIELNIPKIVGKCKERRVRNGGLKEAKE